MDVSKRPFDLMLKEPGRRVCKLLCISSRDLKSRTALRHMPLFPAMQERNFRARVICQSGPEGIVERSYQLASAMLALAFAAVMLIAGQQFIEHQANKRDQISLPAKARTR